MNSFYSFNITINRTELPLNFYWDEAQKLTELSWSDPSGVLPCSEPPYAVAALAREVKNFFKQGEPLLPLHWDLIAHTKFSDFSKKVYEAVLQIPHGETRTYAWVAKRIGKPLAARAVGQALRRNSFPILIPCHRVVADKTLGGFMGCDDPERFEIQMKTWLLNHERNYLNPPFEFMRGMLHLA